MLSRNFYIASDTVYRSPYIVTYMAQKFGFCIVCDFRILRLFKYSRLIFRFLRFFNVDVLQKCENMGRASVLGIVNSRRTDAALDNLPFVQCLIVRIKALAHIRYFLAVERFADKFDRHSAVDLLFEFRHDHRVDKHLFQIGVDSVPHGLAHKPRRNIYRFIGVVFDINIKQREIYRFKRLKHFDGLRQMCVAVLQLSAVFVKRAVAHDEIKQQQHKIYRKEYSRRRNPRNGDGRYRIIYIQNKSLEPERQTR